MVIMETLQVLLITYPGYGYNVGSRIIKDGIPTTVWFFSERRGGCLNEYNFRQTLNNTLSGWMKQDRGPVEVRRAYSGMPDWNTAEVATDREPFGWVKF